MNLNRTTLAQFLSDPAQAADIALAALMLEIAQSVISLAGLIAEGDLADVTGKLESRNVQGETQMKLDVVSNDLFIDSFRRGGLVQGIVSEELDAPVLLSAKPQQSPFLVIFDPLDGSSNVPVNVSVGSIFSVLPAPHDRPASMQDYLQAGSQQLAAAYALYGPATMLVLTLGRGTHGFTLDRKTSEFVLTHAAMQVPEDTAEFAINASNERFWEPPVKRYVAECKAGASDLRGKDFNTRWVASMVADIHRILMRGGIYLYPKDSKDMTRAGRLRLMYEVSPMAMLVEQAGGIASTGRMRVLDIVPDNVHQRMPVVIGSCNEVLRVERYHREYDQGHGESDKMPFFSDRSFYM